MVGNGFVIANKIVDMGGTVTIPIHLSHDSNVQPFVECVTVRVSLNILTRRVVVSIFPQYTICMITYIIVQLCCI